jgi:hypothetical protein
MATKERTIGKYRRMAAAGLFGAGGLMRRA